MRESRYITYHCDCETSGCDTSNDFVDLVCVDTQTVKGAWGSEFHMGLGGKVGGVASMRPVSE
jgi:hypothetical protein